eukprot:2631786-Alexandrium_andersonii.AAC.1
MAARVALSPGRGAGMRTAPSQEVEPRVRALHWCILLLRRESKNAAPNLVERSVARDPPRVAL